MLIDTELYTAINTVIADLINTTKQEYNYNLDMLVTQTDKYENTKYESIIYGLGSSKGLNTDKYYFNAIQDENSKYFALADKYFNEPVSYYENVGTVDRGSLCVNPILYHIQVETFRRIITVYKVCYNRNEPVYTKINTINLKPSKFQKK